MKKRKLNTILTILTLFLMGVCSLAGCGKSDTDDDSVSPNNGIIVADGDIPVVSTEKVVSDYYLGPGGTLGATPVNVTIDNWNAYSEVTIKYSVDNGANWNVYNGTAVSVNSGNSLSLKVEYDVPTIPPASVHRYYYFNGWYIKKNSTESLVSSNSEYSFTVTENVNLSLHMTSNETDPTYINYRYYVITVSEPAGAGTTSGGFFSDELTQTTISATPNPGYKFDHWDVDYTFNNHDKGNNYSATMRYNDNPGVISLKKNTFNVNFDNPSTLPKDNIHGYAVCKAKFVKESCKISLGGITPNEGGTVKVNGVEIYESNTVTVNGMSDINVSVTENPGYTFDNCYYTDSEGMKHTYYEKNFTINQVYEDVNLYVEYKSDKLESKINALADPAVGGSTQIDVWDINNPTDPSKVVAKGSSVEVKNGTKVTLKAIPNNGYVFDYWRYASGVRDYGTQIKDDPTDPDKVTRNELTIDTVKQDDTIYAVFVKEEISVGVVISPDAGGIVTLNGVNKASGTTTTLSPNVPFELEAKPSAGYVFDKWTDDQGNGYTGEKIRISGLTENRTFTAIFVNGKYTVSTVSSPVNGGTSTVNGAEFTQVQAGESVSLKAEPAPGYIFEKWTNQQGDEYRDADLNIANVNCSDVYTAHYLQGALTVNIRTAPSGGGKVRFNDGEFIESGSFGPINSGSNITLTAEPADNYVFERWEDSKGRTYSTNPLNLLDLKESETYTAVFSNGKYTVKVVSSPINGGQVTANGKEGYVEVLSGEKVTLKASPEKGYRFEKWTNQEGETYTDETLVINSVYNSDTYTAHFLSGEVDFTIDLTPEGAGRVGLDSKGYVTGRTSYKIEAGSNLTLKAEANGDYTFERWEDSEGKIYTTNPLQLINVKGTETFTAVFNNNNMGGLRVVSEPASGGHVTKTFCDGSRTLLEAKPNRGWYFVGWKCKGIYFSNCSRCMVNDNGEDVTYTGIFAKDKNFDARTDISEMYFYDAKRLYDTPNYSVTREGMIAQAAAVIAGEASQYANSTPGLKEYKAYLSLRDYYAGSLDMATIKFVEGVLTTTKGEVIGISDFTNVDALMEKVKIITDKKFGERYDSQIIAAVTTTPPEGFDGLVRTYLWKNTGAENGDNLYILYRTVNSEYEEMAAVADEDGVVRFTLEDALLGSEFALVKVVME